MRALKPSSRPPASAVAGLFLVLGVGCEATSRGLDPAVRVDAGPVDDEPDAGLEPGVRLFTGRIGFVYGADPPRFSPTDLSRWTLRARSDLGASTPVVDGPGRFSVRAAGRLELIAIPPDPGDPRYVISTEAAQVDLSEGGREGSDDTLREELRLELELQEPWSETDALTVRSSGLWEGEVTVPASSVGQTRLSGLVVRNRSNIGRLVGEDLWVLRHEDAKNPTTEPPVVEEAGLLRDLSAAALAQPIAVRLSRRAPTAPGTRWAFTAWGDAAASDGWGTLVWQNFVRADRVSIKRLVGPACASRGTAPRWSPQYGSLLSGQLPGLEPVPEGYVVCTGAAGYFRQRGASPADLEVPFSEACACGERPDEFELEIGPVRAPRLDGRPLEASETVVRPPFELSWLPPERGVARGYVVHLEGRSGRAVLVTDTTQVTVPADVFPSGEPVAPTFVAIDDLERPPVESPLTRSARWQSTQWSRGSLLQAP